MGHLDQVINRLRVQLVDVVHEEMFHTETTQLLLERLLRPRVRQVPFGLQSGFADLGSYRFGQLGDVPSGSAGEQKTCHGVMHFHLIVDVCQHIPLSAAGIPEHHYDGFIPFRSFKQGEGAPMIVKV